MSDSATGKTPNVPYAPPVAHLLTLGETADVWERPWPDYVGRFGLTTADVPALIRMATDPELNELPEGDQAWAPVHAWRALGQLHAEEAVGPLVGLLAAADDDDDLVYEEMPTVLAMLGGGAAPALEALIAEAGTPHSTRLAAAEALRRIAEVHPETRDGAVAAIGRLLEDSARNDPTLNGFLIGELIELRAVEAAPRIERAFAADEVDLSIAGDWEDVQVALGLLQARITPPPRYHAPLLPFAGDLHESPAPAGASSRKERRKKAQKRKTARQSRRRNRKKKR